MTRRCKNYIYGSLDCVGKTESELDGMIPFDYYILAHQLYLSLVIIKFSSVISCVCSSFTPCCLYFQWAHVPALNVPSHVTSGQRY